MFKIYKYSVVLTNGQVYEWSKTNLVYKVFREIDVDQIMYLDLYVYDKNLKTKKKHRHRFYFKYFKSQL